MSYDVFLDCGAYSAAAKGGKINVDGYCEWVNEYKDLFTVVTGLDLIPIRKNTEKFPRAQKIMECAEETFKNWEYMREKKGVDSIPVMHTGDSAEWVKKYLDAGCTYLGLAPNGYVGARDYKKQWFDACYNSLVDKDGFPKIKTHLFGVTDIKLIWAYPAYSVDSARWVHVSRGGTIAVPKKNQDGTWNFKDSGYSISVGSRSAASQFFGYHLTTFPKEVQNLAKEWLEFCEVDYDSVLNGTCKAYAFYQVNLRYFIEIEKSIGDYPKRWDAPRKTAIFSVGV